MDTYQNPQLILIKSKPSQTIGWESLVVSHLTPTIFILLSSPVIGGQKLTFKIKSHRHTLRFVVLSFPFGLYDLTPLADISYP